MSRLRLVIFDMDGLMVDSEGAQRTAMNSALAPSGVSIGEAEWRGMIGRRAREILADLREQHGITAGVEELLDAKDRAYRAAIRSHVTPMPGLYELVEKCKGAGVAMAVASSSGIEDVRAVVQALRLEDAFSILVSGDDVSRGKPDPEIFLVTARRMKVEPRYCVVLEDTAHGVQAARRAGMMCVAVPNSFTEGQDFSRAGMVVASLLDLDIPALEALNMPEQ
jgi:HAD superfamily hydrolase (TIGR01509 family)